MGGIASPTARSHLHSPAGAPPEPRRSTSVLGTEVLRRGSPEPRRSTSVPGTEVLRRGSGGAPAGIWRCERGVGDAIPPIPPETAKKRNTSRKCCSRRWLRDQHRVSIGATPGHHRQNTVGTGRTYPPRPRAPNLRIRGASAARAAPWTPIAVPAWADPLRHACHPLRVAGANKQVQDHAGPLLAGSSLIRFRAPARTPAVNTAKTTGPTLPLASDINGDANNQKEITPQATANLDIGSSPG